MEIAPKTVSGSLGGILQLGCGTWTGFFYLWAWIWTVMGNGTQIGYGSQHHGEPDDDHGEVLCTWLGGSGGTLISNDRCATVVPWLIVAEQQTSLPIIFRASAPSTAADGPRAVERTKRSTH